MLRQRVSSRNKMKVKKRVNKNEVLEMRVPETLEERPFILVLDSPLGLSVDTYLDICSNYLDIF